VSISPKHARSPSVDCYDLTFDFILVDVDFEIKDEVGFV
jgi:hypothetical protein